MKYDIWPVGTPWWRHYLEKDEEETMSKQSLSKEIRAPLHDALQEAKRREWRSTPPRLFWLEYNHSKLPTKNAWTEVRKLDMQSCWGTLYPDGGASLSMGSYFGGIEDLKRYLEATGEYSITWLEEINKEKVAQ